MATCIRICELFEKVPLGKKSPAFLIRPEGAVLNDRRDLSQLLLAEEIPRRRRWSGLSSPVVRPDALLKKGTGEEIEG